MKSLPDLRIKIDNEDRGAIIARLEANELQKHIAADFGVSISTISTINAARFKNGVAPHSGARVSVPNGETVESMCRRAMKTETLGTTPTDAAKKIGMISDSASSRRRLISARSIAVRPRSRAASRRSKST